MPLRSVHGQAWSVEAQARKRIPLLKHRDPPRNTSLASHFIDQVCPLLEAGQDDVLLWPGKPFLRYEKVVAPEFLRTDKTDSLLSINPTRQRRSCPLGRSLFGQKYVPIPHGRTTRHLVCRNKVHLLTRIATQLAGATLPQSPPSVVQTTRQA